MAAPRAGCEHGNGERACSLSFVAGTHQRVARCMRAMAYAPVLAVTPFVDRHAACSFAYAPPLSASPHSQAHIKPPLLTAEVIELRCKWGLFQYTLSCFCAIDCESEASGDMALAAAKRSYTLFPKYMMPTKNIFDSSSTCQAPGGPWSSAHDVRVHANMRMRRNDTGQVSTFPSIAAHT